MAAVQVVDQPLRYTWSFTVALNCFCKPFLCKGSGVYVLPVKKHSVVFPEEENLGSQILSGVTAKWSCPVSDSGQQQVAKE